MESRAYLLVSTRSFAPVMFFFFQAEDGIRDVAVTGVQTCALPISLGPSEVGRVHRDSDVPRYAEQWRIEGDRKSTRLNSSHGYISYAVFCLKKKKKQNCIRMCRLNQAATGIDLQRIEMPHRYAAAD